MFSSNRDFVFAAKIPTAKIQWINQAVSGHTDMQKGPIWNDMQFLVNHPLLKSMTIWHNGAL